jgi:hypothetical protein
MQGSTTIVITETNSPTGTQMLLLQLQLITPLTATLSAMKLTCMNKQPADGRHAWHK